MAVASQATGQHADWQTSRQRVIAICPSEVAHCRFTSMATRRKVIRLQHDEASINAMAINVMGPNA